MSPVAQRMTRRFVVNAVNLFGRGSRSILESCVDTLIHHLPADWEAEVYVGDAAGLGAAPNVRITTVTPRHGRWAGRLWFELFDLKRREAGRRVDIFLSLQNASARIEAGLKVAYCGQNLPLAAMPLVQMWAHKRVAVQRFIYGFLYRFAIGQRTLVIVQQQWTRQAFAARYGLTRSMVARPVPADSVPARWRRPPVTPQTHLTILAPLAAFPHKDVETVIAAARALALRNPDFTLDLTIDPAESAYAAALAASAADVPQLRFIGLLPRDQLDQAYATRHLMLFSSRIESWGLPLSEARAHGIGILAVDHPYAHEAIGDYDGVSFFPAGDSLAIARMIHDYWTGTASLGSSRASQPPPPYAANWPDLLAQLLTMAQQSTEADQKIC